MAKNGLTDLNNHLFEALERLNDDEYMSKHGDTEIQRARAITGVASQLVSLGALTLDAQKYTDERGQTNRVISAMLGGKKDE